jgi:hypothetical protein
LETKVAFSIIFRLENAGGPAWSARGATRHESTRTR